MSLIIRLDQAKAPEHYERTLVGGKARHLMQCVDAGLPVPPGFTVTTQAYDTFLRRGRSPLPSRRGGLQ